jgi:hypothetical protein
MINEINEKAVYPPQRLLTDAYISTSTIFQMLICKGIDIFKGLTNSLNQPEPQYTNTNKNN